MLRGLKYLRLLTTNGPVCTAPVPGLPVCQVVASSVTTTVHVRADAGWTSS